MFCEHCGKPIADNSIFCQHCGKAVQDEIETPSTPDDNEEKQIPFAAHTTAIDRNTLKDDREQDNNSAPKETVPRAKHEKPKNNNGFFSAQDDKWSDYIPGFRSGKRSHMIIAGIYYALCLISLFTGSDLVFMRICNFSCAIGLIYLISAFFKPPFHKQRGFYVGVGVFCLAFGIVCNNLYLKVADVPKSNTVAEVSEDIIATDIPEPEPTKTHDEIMAEYEQSKEDARQSINELKETVDETYHEVTGTEHKSEYDRMREQAIRVSWRDVVDDYEANQIASDEKYKGKYLIMSGTVSDIGREILGQPYVTFEKDIVRGIRVTFDKSEEAKIAQLSKGSAITIVGKCTGELITGTVAMHNCYITY